MSDVSRRDFLSAATLAGAVAGAEGAARADDDGARDKEHGEQPEPIPTFRYPMETETGRHTEGGFSREATIKELPISEGLAGVSMRLKPGGVRELHWHAKAAEWAFVLKGRVRTTVISPDGTSETNDFEPGDVWYFPRGHGHALQGMGPGEAHFILIFDDGAFSEFGTFGASDWLAVTPPEVLAKNFGVPRSTFDKFPRTEAFIPQGAVPPEKQNLPLMGAQRTPPSTHKYPLMSQEPHRFRGGQERRVTVKEFPVSVGITGVVLELEPGALRELHWHPNADEWQYWIEGSGRVGLFGSHGRSRIEEFSVGDAGYIPRGFGHYVENTGKTPLKVLIGFNSGEYQVIDASTWFASNPTDILSANFGVPPSTFDGFPRRRVFIAPKEGASSEGEGPYKS
jgi:oxalate decarboxylase